MPSERLVIKSRFFFFSFVSLETRGSTVHFCHILLYELVRVFGPSYTRKCVFLDPLIRGCSGFSILLIWRLARRHPSLRFALPLRSAASLASASCQTAPTEPSRFELVTRKRHKRAFLFAFHAQKHSCRYWSTYESKRWWHILYKLQLHHSSK